MRKRLHKSIALILAAIILTTVFPPVCPPLYAHAAVSPAYVPADEFISEMISNNYTKVSANYTALPYRGADIYFAAASQIEDIGTAAISAETFHYEKAGQALAMNLGDTVVLSVNVPETATYLLHFDYYSTDLSILPIGMTMKINGEFPFYECRSLKFETTWVARPERAFDRFGDEVVTVPDKLSRWETKALMDGSYRNANALSLELNAGQNTIELSVTEGGFLLGGLTLLSPDSGIIPEYAGSVYAAGNALIEIEGEDFAYRNDSAIHSVAEYDTSLSPFEVKHSALNTIDSDSFKKAGQRVTYDFYVDQPGHYYVSMNYRQSDKSDFPVFVDIAVDGKLPSSAFASYGLRFSSRYRTITLTDAAGENMSIYLDAGEHDISFTISNENIRHLFEGLDEVIAGVNDLSLEITKVVGKQMDKYRDLRLSRYIPGVEDRLFAYAARINEMHDSVLAYSGSKKTVSIFSPAMIARKQIISLAENPDEIPYRVNELSISISSASHHLANAVNNLLDNNVAIDRIWIHQADAKLPKRPNIFKSLMMNLNRFFTSFTKNAYSTGNTNPEHLQVWVNRSTQFVQIMQKMIDESFTPATGIKVDISIMPDQRKLVLSSTAGRSPDVACGINYTIPYELAIRGALADMMQFDGFRAAAAPYNDGFFLTACINESIYAMPETMNFWVLFYRTDIMAKLGIRVPDTMQDVIDILPELQMRGLNFYQSASGMRALRNFHGTTPLIHQHGGSLYKATAQEGTNLGSPESIQGFTYLTELYTIYNIPIDVDNFYQRLRNGDIPLGIADYMTYNLMTNAAPELRDSWSISLVPGVLREDGTIDRTSCANAESSVIFKSTPERELMAWQFVEWWSSTDVQAEYGQTLQIIYGEDYMWSTANIDAFMRLPWKTEDKLVIAEQMTHVIDIARVPGTYLLEREMSNAFNDIVANGKTAQARIDKAIKSIDREIMRKLEEFEYIDSEGNTLREYRIPTVEIIRELLGR